MQAKASTRWTIEDLGIFEIDRAHTYEIIDGELFVTRAPRWEHQRACGRIFAVLDRWSSQTQGGEAAVTPGVIFSEFDRVIPDVVWASHQRLANIMDEAGHLNGAPELMVEVLSPGMKNEQRDRVAKLKLYSVAGVSEYWIVDLVARKVSLYQRQEAILQLVATLYDTDTLYSSLMPDVACGVSELL
jgi:Uma2 family endonuclease